jgi:hypothetical protein
MARIGDLPAQAEESRISRHLQQSSHLSHAGEQRLSIDFSRTGRSIDSSSTAAIPRGLAESR